MSAPADDHLQPMVAEALLALGERLEALDPSRWDEASLCEGWRVREVVAHLTMAARYGVPEFEAELRAAAFDFDVLSNRVAERDGALPVERLLADLRSEVMQRWAPPGGGYAGALSHVVIHGADVTVPLGLGRAAPDDATRHVLDGLTRGGMHVGFGIALDGVELRADDLDWSFGAGRPVHASAEDLVAALAGRAVPALRLT